MEAVQWLAVISGLVAGFRSCIKLPRICGRTAVHLFTYLIGYFLVAFRNPKVMRVIGGFCAEVAVLVAVFPTLEILIRGTENMQPTGSAAHQITSPHLGTVAYASGGVVFVFLVLAIIIENRWG
jgi:hypothetical protein